MKTIYICLFCISITILFPEVRAQVPFQTVKGTVYEKETQVPLPGATILVINSEPKLAAVSDEQGKFKIEKVPVGRYDIQFGFLGYEPLIIPEILVGSAKEVIINAGLTESVVKLNEVEVQAHVRKDQPLNNMAIISARMMNMEEAHRYAGGFDDPARLASSFAGVTTGYMEENSIVVRGNAPKGLLWRLEGVEIPNPNHFANMAVLGGGGITLFSSQMLANSDFYTGAFPAEYGNAMSGVFDIKLRTGNSEQYEHAFQAGAMGIDVSSEGPIVKGKSASYLFNYRYSTFGIIKIVLPEEANIPVYQDLCFKMNFPLDKYGTLSIWGIGGKDKINGYALTDSSEWDDIWDRENMSGRIDLGAIGVNHKIIIGKRSLVESVFSASGNSTGFDTDILDSNLIARHPTNSVTDANWRYTFSSKLSTKFSARHSNQTGIVLNNLHYNTDLQASMDIGSPLIQLVNAKGSAELYQIFSQSKMEFIPGFTLNAGLHLLYLSLNKELSAEPRLGIAYSLPTGLTFSIGYGKHSQLEPLGIYLAQVNSGNGVIKPNINLRMTKSHHFIAGIDYSLNKYIRLKVEPYVQYLYDVPVIPDSSYSAIIMENAWSLADELKNDGTGLNYGIDFTFERFLHKGYYYLITASLFEAKYTGGDGIQRNSRYNRNYVVNFLFGKEWKVRDNNILGINGKFHFLGGNRNIPINLESSINQHDIVLDYTRAFEEHDPSIYQFDLTLTYKVNKKKYSGSWALQVMNVLGRKEFYGYSYNYRSGMPEAEKVIIIIPSVSYKIDF
jgi:hypothetical protein